MRKFVGIWQGKIFDMRSNLVNKRNRDFDGNLMTEEQLKEVVYVENYGNNCILDTWDFEKECSLQDSPRRTRVPEKTVEQLKIIELKEQITTLESRLEKLESQTTAMGVKKDG